MAQVRREFVSLCSAMYEVVSLIGHKPANGKYQYSIVVLVSAYTLHTGSNAFAICMREKTLYIIGIGKIAKSRVPMTRRD